MLGKLWNIWVPVWDKLISNPASPVVWLVEWFVHVCGICTAWRGAFVGAAVALLIAGHQAQALFLFLLVGVLVLVERLIEHDQAVEVLPASSEDRRTVRPASDPPNPPPDYVVSPTADENHP